jgi:hypothetical protein
VPKLQSLEIPSRTSFILSQIRFSPPGHKTGAGFQG